ncbi:MAG: hypothetical protein GY953_22155, partial [bacterium]|nr:hypothetical protein [bacterium]
MTLIDARRGPELASALSRLPRKPKTLAQFLEAVDDHRLLKTKPAALKRSRLVVDQAMLLIGGVYVHLPTMRDLYAVNPVAPLELLKRELPELSEPAFQARYHEALLAHAETLARRFATDAEPASRALSRSPSSRYA